MKIWEPVAAIVAQRVVAVVRTDDAGTAHAAVSQLFAAGLRAVEISLTTPDALAVIAESAVPSEAFLGAGTVLDEASAIAARRAGASFLVTPTLDPAVIAAGRRHGIPTVPGVASPTEALRALEAGADLVKLFPGSAWTPASLRDVLAALPQLSLVPTGGIALTEAARYLDAGAVAVGLGSGLTRGDPADIAPRVASLLAQLADR
ncbi:MAG: bifunctional 4-hydroxy-2-oxoglutarate aldolase/2-dehydro-3-deoxy-phosphogluconate aldolase [Nitriliruptoraceae bacterium]|nr:bifunctional 4-hydroxy-2-oxoglutarate aldolase/2-dehydro-3-deoxy-phosphogluconate aldolase [Nitriliruptoraceae bacterium]